MSAVYGIVHARCPRCRNGRVYNGSMLRLGRMHRQCAVCGLKFEREQGYFLGAMYISYFIAIPIIAAFAVVIWWITNWTFAKVLLVAALAFVPLSPLVARFSRVLWMYVDRLIDPD